MSHILVLADDLTGAAEIAGIGWRFGLPTRLLREPLHDSFDGLTVIDTDSRLLSPTEAAATVRRFLGNAPVQRFDLIYKKIDSVLRGPVMAEAEAMAKSLGRESVVFLPQNPSRGRTIGGGVYRIDGVPLSATAFGNDPEFPATSSNAADLIGPTRMPVTIANATTAEQVRGWAKQVAPSTLPVGGADFFEAMLHAGNLTPQKQPWNEPLAGPVLMACGSASAQSAILAQRAAAEGMGVFSMSTVWGHDRDGWIGTVGHALRLHGRALMNILGPIDRSTGAPRRLAAEFTAAVRDVLILADPPTLLIEGGATAAAVCAAMRWQRFDVEGELAAGVVALRVRPEIEPGASADGGMSWAGPRVIVKPGSYAWPDVIWRQNRG